MAQNQLRTIFKWKHNDFNCKCPRIGLGKNKGEKNDHGIWEKFCLPMKISNLVDITYKACSGWSVEVSSYRQHSLCCDMDSLLRSECSIEFLERTTFTVISFLHLGFSDYWIVDLSIWHLLKKKKPSLLNKNIFCF